ncbi:sulfotransferase family cytosolic 1B member 1 [Huso huso]|uniref:Sulfotransferase family cytosolic 1B member 1 n=1 Tax=Huso huso TaxID=61971 RepID=A0ABR0Y4X4_HUSHU
MRKTHTHSMEQGTEAERGPGRCYWERVGNLVLGVMKSQKAYTEQLKDVKEVFQRFTLKPVQGVPLMKPIADNWEKVESFRAQPTDLLIATYPKAGKIP